MPSFLRAAITRFIWLAATFRASLTVVRVTETPRRRSATSGAARTRPVPLTLIMCSLGAVGSTARAEWGARAELARAAARAPASTPTARARVRALGRVKLTVVGSMVGSSEGDGFGGQAAVGWQPDAVPCPTGSAEVELEARA